MNNANKITNVLVFTLTLLLVSALAVSYARAEKPHQLSGHEHAKDSIEQCRERFAFVGGRNKSCGRFKWPGPT